MSGERRPGQAAAAAGSSTRRPGAEPSFSMRQRRLWKAATEVRCAIDTSVVPGSRSFSVRYRPLSLAFGIEAGRRLVKEQPVRLGQQRTRHRHALLLATGQLLRPVLVAVETVDELRQAHVLQRPYHVIAAEIVRRVRIRHHMAQ